MLAVDVDGAGGAFTASRPQLVAEGPFDRHGLTPNYELTLDGQRLLVLKKAKDQEEFDRFMSERRQPPASK